PDQDGDGVIDVTDFCADTPPGVSVDHNCRPELEKIFVKRINSSLFLPGSSIIDSSQTAVLDTVANYLVWFPQVSAVVYGYTDDIGPDDANLLLSQKRARAVKHYLEKRGIAATRLQAVGLGETDFIASNRTRAGREQNRRVEIEFSFPDSD
ncbi:MAG: OmpA family protein, partial [bacterium]